MDHNNFGPDDVSPQSSGADVSGTSSHDAGGMKERARDFAGSAQDRLADVGSSVRERASHMKDSLADALETGADKLRARASSGETGNLAGATGSASVALDDAMAASLEDPNDDPEVAVEKKDKNAILRQCLTSLSREHREIIDLVYYHEKSVEEAARIVGIPEATVKTRMFYARKKLSELLKAAGVESAVI